MPRTSDQACPCGQSVFLPEAAESLIAELRSSMVTIRHTGQFTDGSERAKVLAIYESASAVLREKLGGGDTAGAHTAGSGMPVHP
ncbi:MAG: hypothetical protein Q8N51_11490 [Gammaproteobacteria bacterium]|nr:hypothetical protein [Gammaproteobacteria bacterium]